MRGEEVRLESGRSWEQDESFHDVLYEWMTRAPWLLISAAFHLLLFFVLASVPWRYFHEEPASTITASVVPPPEEVFEPLPDEPIPQEPIEEPVEEPSLQDATLEETVADELAEAEGDPDVFSDDPFDEQELANVVGLGPGGGRPAGKLGGDRGGAPRGGRAIEVALEHGLEWLAKHQAPSGAWDADGFDAECGEIGAGRCDGAGEADFDVGVTGLALLAFLGMGNTTEEGPYRDVVRRGISWLVREQDPDTGLVGGRTSKEFVYNHAIATLAICENFYFTGSPRHRRVAQRAVDFICENRNPYGAWRYDVPPVGDNDSSVTGWMVFALSAAKEGGLRVDERAFEGALAWFDDVTDASTGRVGYQAFGTHSSRVAGVNDHFPAESGEAMTAVGLLCRIFLEQDPAEEPLLEKHADLLLRALPEWDPDAHTSDLYAWYYGTYAMFQMGAHDPRYWSRWERSLEPAVVETQSTNGDRRGSWDPIGPWGYAGGRVYSTALMVLCLEVHFRYAKVLGSR